VHYAALHGPRKRGAPIGGRAAGHGGAFGLIRAVCPAACPAPCKGVQGAHDGCPVQVICGVVQPISERVMQGADGFRRIAGLADPKLMARLADQGGTMNAGSPADFGKLIAPDTIDPTASRKRAVIAMQRSRLGSRWAAPGGPTG
jgi:hypothetical protein